MQTAKVFKSGNSQAIRLPKEFRVNTSEMLISKDGDKIILTPKPKSWHEFFINTPDVSEDFMDNRNQSPPQVRDELF